MIRAHHWLLSSTVVALACNQVLGIEDAQVDPTLVELFGGRPSGGTGGTDTPDPVGGIGGMGGSDATGGTPMGTAGNAATGGTEEPGPSAGGSDPGAGADGQGDAGGSGGPLSLCDQYCDVVMQYCTGDRLQYGDLQQCLAVCALFPQGEVGDPDANTITCRLKYASKARYGAGTERAAYCRQAGPGGDGQCGSNCEGLCSVIMGTCSEGRTDPYFYASYGACLSECAGLPEVPYIHGDDSVADSDTLQCRLFHATSAVMMDPEEHCEHALGVTLCEHHGG